MSTSGTYTFNPKVAAVLDEAWERCGLDPTQIDVRNIVSAKRSLNLLLRSELSADQINLWTVSELTETPTVGEDEIILPAGAIDVLEASSRDSQGNDVPMVPIGRSDWHDISDKDTAGRPDRYWVERSTGLKTLHFWPIMGATSYTLVLNVVSGIEDTGDLHNEAYVPDLWYDVLCAGLAKRLAVKEAPDRLAMLEGQFDIAHRLARQSDRERAPLVIGARYGRGW